MNHLLIVDDEAEIRESLEEILQEEGYAVTSTPTAAEAMVLMRDDGFAGSTSRMMRRISS